MIEQKPVSQQLMQRLEAVDSLKAQYRHDLINTNQIIDLLNDRLKLLRQKWRDGIDVGYTQKMIYELEEEMKLLNQLIRFYDKQKINF